MKYTGHYSCILAANLVKRLGINAGLGKNNAWEEAKKQRKL
jgi:hypothetical protein